MKFSSYITRDWCGPNCHEKEDFLDFQTKHTKAILKPLDDCGGHRIHIIDFEASPNFSKGGGTGILHKESMLDRRIDCAA